MVKDGWLTPKGVKYFFIVILFFAILGALSSCSNEVYYLEVNDYQELTVCVNIVDSNGEIVCLLDGNIDDHATNSAIIITEINNGQIGFKSILSASEAYWNIVK